MEKRFQGVYLFVGEDEFSKDVRLEKIKGELFPPHLEAFNFEILYSKGLDLKTLQEAFLRLPVKAKQRLILIKGAIQLSPEIKQYIVSYLKRPFAHLALVLETRRIDKQDSFFNQISGLAKLINFPQSLPLNAFDLARQILQGRSKQALRLLRQLLLAGEKPERILGAIRYQLQQEGLLWEEKKRKISLLLDCDIDIKRGKLRPEFALERLLLSMCYF